MITVVAWRAGIRKLTEEFFDVGKKIGRQEGYDKGFQDGFYIGYNSGFIKGMVVTSLAICTMGVVGWSIKKLNYYKSNRKQNNISLKAQKVLSSILAILWNS